MEKYVIFVPVDDYCCDILAVCNTDEQLIKGLQYFRAEGYSEVEYEIVPERDFEDVELCSQYVGSFVISLTPIKGIPMTYKMGEVSGHIELETSLSSDPRKTGLDCNFHFAVDDIRVTARYISNERIPGYTSGGINLETKKFLRDKINEYGLIKILIPHVDCDVANFDL